LVVLAGMFATDSLQIVGVFFGLIAVFGLAGFAIGRFVVVPLPFIGAMIWAHYAYKGEGDDVAQSLSWLESSPPLGCSVVSWRGGGRAS
jgi:hypothetical protein